MSASATLTAYFHNDSNVRQDSYTNIVKGLGWTVVYCDMRSAPTTELKSPYIVAGRFITNPPNIHADWKKSCVFSLHIVTNGPPIPTGKRGARIRALSFNAQGQLITSSNDTLDITDEANNKDNVHNAILNCLRQYKAANSLCHKMLELKAHASTKQHVFDPASLVRLYTGDKTEDASHAIKHWTVVDEDGQAQNGWTEQGGNGSGNGITVKIMIVEAHNIGHVNNHEHVDSADITLFVHGSKTNAVEICNAVAMRGNLSYQAVATGTTAQQRKLIIQAVLARMNAGFTYPSRAMGPAKDISVLMRDMEIDARTLQLDVNDIATTTR